MAGGGKHKLEYVKQEVPKFLRDFKAKGNFKEGPTVDTKRQRTGEKNSENDDDREEREDEKPVICVLKEGDLTEEEYEKLQTGGKDTEMRNTDKLTFKKPTSKRTSDKSIESTTSSKKKSRSGSEKKPMQTKKLDNKSLLSFGDDDDE